MDNLRVSCPPLTVQPPQSHQAQQYSNSPARKHRHLTNGEMSSPLSESGYNSRVRRRKEDQQSVMQNPNLTPKSSTMAGSPLVSSASPFLQQLIKEQRAARGSSAGPSPSDDANHESRPHTPATITQSQEDASSERQRKIANALSVGLKQPEEMGVREMDQYVHKLNKLNFDLKLEIFHRSQQNAALSKRLEQMQELEERVRHMEELEDELQELREVEENNQRLRESNERLQWELDKRDQAVSEAVNLICELEARIDTLEAGRDTDPSSEAAPDTSETIADLPDAPREPQSPKNRLIPDVPDRTSSRRGTRSVMSSRSTTRTPTAAHRPRRQPSFVRIQTPSTSALRSVYLAETNKSHAALSIVSQSETILSEDEARRSTASPNLSTLSECSYFDPSMSPTRQLHPDLPSITPRITNPAQRPVSRKENAAAYPGRSRVEEWIRPKDMSSGPRRSRTLPVAEAPNKYERPSLGPAFGAEQSAETAKHRSPTLDVPMFGNGRFPPTPDTMSTSQANTRSNSNSSIIAEKSQYDRLYTPFSVDRTLRRPRSADDITRPSTAMTTDDLESLYEVSFHDLGLEPESHLQGIFPSSIHANQLLSTPRQLKALVDTEYNSGERLNELSSKRLESQSPPLTPQDWLDAARSTPAPTQTEVSQHDRSKKPAARGETEVETPSKPPSNEHQGLIPDSPNFRESGLPPAAALRVRLADNAPSPRQSSGTLQRLHGMFSRPSTGGMRQAANAEQEDGDGLPPPITRIKRRFSTTRRQDSTKSPARAGHNLEPVALPASDDPRPKRGARQFAPSSAHPSSDIPQSRPCTAGSLDAGKRRLSGWNWIRGSLGIKDSLISRNYSATMASSPASQSPAASRNNHKSPQQVLPSSPAPVRVQISIDSTEVLSSPDGGRKSKLPSRQTRRGKEHPGYHQ